MQLIMCIHSLGASGGISEAGCVFEFFQGLLLLTYMLDFIQTMERLNWKEERILINSLLSKQYFKNQYYFCKKGEGTLSEHASPTACKGISFSLVY